MVSRQPAGHGALGAGFRGSCRHPPSGWSGGWSLAPPCLELGSLRRKQSQGAAGEGGFGPPAGEHTSVCVTEVSHTVTDKGLQTGRPHDTTVPVACRSLPGWARGRIQGENGRLGSELAKLRLEILSGRLSRCPLPWGRTGQSSWPLSKHRERRIVNTRTLVLALLPIGWVTLGQLLNLSVPPSMKSMKPAPPPSGCCEY